MIKDSGARREFSTGAVRDIAEGKGRCDLLPLDIIGNILRDEILIRINCYIRTGDTGCLDAAILTFVSNHTEWERDLYTAMLETSKQYEEGAKNTMNATGRRESQFTASLIPLFVII